MRSKFAFQLPGDLTAHRSAEIDRRRRLRARPGISVGQRFSAPSRGGGNMHGD
jgi:hypothetical protein